MSNNTTNATVNLTLNGQQALQTLNQLRSNALQLETAIAKAAATGNKADLKRLRKELTETRKQIREIESATQQVDAVMKRLNRATPTELNKSLQTLNRQLQYMERGSEAWNKHVAKIKAVKAELAKVNVELRVSESTFQRINRVMNEWGTTIMGAAAALTGLVMAGRSAVSAYAEMDEELANTSKYTGMSRQKVDELNESFKKMDTRTSREQLNELAQEAGRLGKNTLEDVQGYVEAADIINVALVDLGAGATQTIAKLSNIFGVEKMLGTKDAMLSVGSAVNVLSQNCTASKTYLVEFAQRMAGIGAQADMTIPEILAFGATLDANGQKTEMSSSALGKLIMMLNQKPEELSKAVGLNTEQMKELLKTDTTGAVIKFLEQIQKLGSKDGLAVLAPLFKDMGMDGVRMSQVLATLAEHLDMVKWEIGEANKAFTEASSATNEYNIFNNTVQAGIDKAKKRMSELAIELGEKLLPIMKHIYSSGSMLMRMLSAFVDFVIKYKSEIIVASSALAAYKVAVHASSIAMKVHHGWVVLTQAAHKAASAVMATYRTGVLMCSVAYNRLTGNLTRAAAAQRALNTAQKANLFGLLAAGVVTLITALSEYGKSLSATEMAEKALGEIRGEAAKKADEERMHIDILREAAMNEKLSLDERHKAIDELNRIIPDYNAHLDKTTGKYVENKDALDRYIESLVRMYEIEGAKGKLSAIGKEKADIRIRQHANEREQQEAEKELHSAELQYSLHGAAASSAGMTSGMKALSQGNSSSGQGLTKAKARVKRAAEEMEELRSQMEILAEQERLITEVYGEDMQRAEVSQGTNATSEVITPPTLPGEGTASKDKFAKEKEWRQREEAMNRIAYARGEKDYEAYTRRMDEIAVGFYAKELEHTDLSKLERLTIEADYYEALKKQADDGIRMTVEAEERAYGEQMASLKQRYIDGKSSTKEYEAAVEMAELEHMRRLVKLTKEGTDERAKAEREYQNRLLSDRQKHLKALEEAEKRHQEALKKVKDSVFGLNERERYEAYSSELGTLKEVYNMEIMAAEENAKDRLRIEKAFQEAKMALMRKYNIGGINDARNAVQQAVRDSVEWLESEGGQAFTGTMDTLVSGMSAMFTQLSSIVQAELEIQTEAIEKRYDRELSLAEGNAYREAQLEERKQNEIAAAKKEANKKMFAMQVVQAIAQTAQGALAAYASAAAIPITGWVMAPIAAAMALAAGGLQVAAIRKQQQASEAQGYAEGGYTPKGGKYEEVGVVHAGEWVASQRLLANPVASQMIQTLDHAQRTNTIGSLRQEDVSRSITAPIRIAEASGTSAMNTGAMVAQAASSTRDRLASSKDLSDTMRQLSRRLNEPFVTINTIEGDHGIKKAQEEYEKLMRNKSPKNRR
ncbi:MAG: phage tail tape measure protein [Bacteroidaceae bacterium]|nr:phage tail tape measure protein [Bacteroidaceae bacterium]